MFDVTKGTHTFPMCLGYYIGGKSFHFIRQLNSSFDENEARYNEETVLEQKAAIIRQLFGYPEKLRNNILQHIDDVDQTGNGIGSWHLSNIEKGASVKIYSKPMPRCDESK